MAKYLMILRGVPGSGKSTYAAKIMERFSSLYKATTCKCSADDYFVGKDGVYRFDASKLFAAHNQCRARALAAMRTGIDLVIIDNTNTHIKEMKPYLEIAKEFGYIVRVKVIGENDEDFIKLCILRNVHGVPAESIKRMAERLKQNSED